MNKKVENLLLYVGTIGAIISAIAYLMVMIILVMGITTRMQTNQLLIVSIIGGVAGLMITWMLRSQGIAFASNDEESKSIMKAYHAALNKSKPIKKLHTITWHVVWSSIKDLLTKAITISFQQF